MKAGKTVPAAPEVWGKLRAISEAHAGLPLPDGAGRAIGQPR
jgi:carnitine 3-dehydrogenase